MTVLVYGATGTQGGPVAHGLLERGEPVRVVVRSPEKAADLAAAGAEVVKGDLLDPSSLAAASRGVEAAFVVLSASVPPREYVEHGRNALAAARTAGIGHVVLSTSGIVPEEATGVAVADAKRELLRLMGELTPHAVVLSPTIYLENFSTVMRSAVEQGVVPQPLPSEVPVAYVSLDDHAAAAIAALERPQLAGKRFPVVGPDVLTGPQLAERFARALGRPVRYEPVPADAFGAQLEPFLGAEVAAAIGEMYAYEGTAGARYLAPEVDEHQGVLDFDATPVDAWIAKAF